MRTHALLSFLMLVGCAGGPVYPLAEVVPPGTGDFALEPTPTPAFATLESMVVPLAPVEIVERPGVSGSYRLEIRSGRVSIEAPDEDGRRWALKTLDQLIVEKAGQYYVRTGVIEDHPAFPLRGNKRPLAWEVRYRANFSYRGVTDAALLKIRPQFVPHLSPGGVLDATPASLETVEQFFRTWHARGARRFAIEFDDVTFRLTPESADLYGSYPRAISIWLTACRARLHEIDPDAVLYWLPQTYWTEHPMFQRFAIDVRRAGGLPADMGLVLTGPEIISETIDAAEIAAARRAFGLTTTKVLIYDNLGREGDHGPLRGRDPGLVEEADAVFGERGEFLNRITRLDWAWNPGAYDPERSHLLACRELVGAAGARTLSRLILTADRLDLETRRRLMDEVEKKARNEDAELLASTLARIRHDVVEPGDVDSAGAGT